MCCILLFVQKFSVLFRSSPSRNTLFPSFCSFRCTIQFCSSSSSYCQWSVDSLSSHTTFISLCDVQFLWWEQLNISIGLMRVRIERGRKRETKHIKWEYICGSTRRWWWWWWRWRFFVFSTSASGNIKYRYFVKRFAVGTNAFYHRRVIRRFAPKWSRAYVTWSRPLPVHKDCSRSYAAVCCCVLWFQNEHLSFASSATYSHKIYNDCRCFCANFNFSLLFVLPFPFATCFGRVLAFFSEI